MQKFDVLVVGGSAGGLTAAITARRHYPNASIGLVRKENQVLIPCGIPYIFGTVGSPEKNLIPDQLLDQNQLELTVDEVTSIYTEDRTLHTAGKRTIGYGRLILATGSEPIVPRIPGVELDNVFAVKKDVTYLGNMLQALGDASSVVVIGGGFIGLEFADECRKRDVQVTVVEMLPLCLSLVFDPDLCKRVEEELARTGIQVRTGARAKAFVGNGRVRAVQLESGEEIPADIVILGIGVRPNTRLACQAGLRIGEQGGVWVDRFMRTSACHVFAVGDCAEKVDAVTGKPTNLRLASIATAEARVAGANLFQLRRENTGTIGVFSTKIGNLAAGLAGYGEQRAWAEGIDYVVGEAEAVNRHPGGMPGAMALHVKLVFHKWTRQIIGGQACCSESVGEFINTIACMIQNGVTADRIATYQVGTHPALTASPIAYPLFNAAEMALKESSQVR
ncbi:MAG TPA: FAD-dependent oxidoreductase [Firmicutes bacterium]|nr:FAD-dependent oxidoreductase [Bacillota bacterium]